MLSFVIRRLLVSIPVVIAASIFVFVLVAASGDPLAELRAQPNVSAETIALREAQLNLDKSIPERYVIWAGNALTGDFGETIAGRDVGERIGRGFGVTLRMVLLATLLAVLVSVFLGVVAAVRQYSITDYSATFFAFVFFSMPVFFLAGILKDVAIRLNQAVGQTVFYTIGERSPNLTGDFFERLPNVAGHLALPMLTLALITMAGWSRYQRASMLDVLNSDYIRTARAKGLPERTVIYKHALRNALIPLTSVVAIGFSGLIGGAVITETVFAWQGLGRILIEGILTQDVNVVTAWLILTALVVVLFNALADVIYAFLDPRIRRG